MYVITGDSSGYQTNPDDNVTGAEAKAMVRAYMNATRQDEKFTDDDLRSQPELENYALAYLREYRGTFSFMLDMLGDYRQYGGLSLPKVRGVLNCLRAEILRDQKQSGLDPSDYFNAPSFDAEGNFINPEPEPAPEPDAGVSAGRYCTINHQTGERHFYQVDRPQEGRWAGYIFLRELHTHHPNGDRSIRDKEERLLVLDTIAEDSESLARYGKETGKCGVCHRTLTDPLSVEIGLGPVCREGVGL